GISGIDGLAASMLVASIAVSPIAAWQVIPVALDPVALLAGVGVGISSSVIPYVFDQLAMARLPRATYALMVALLPATATVIGIVVLSQIPSAAEIVGVALVVAGVAVHRESPPSSDGYGGAPATSKVDMGGRRSGREAAIRDERAFGGPMAPPNARSTLQASINLTSHPLDAAVSSSR